MTEYQSIEGAFIPDNMDWGSIIACDYCDSSGVMLSTHEPEREQWFWDCDECGREDASHRLVMKTDSVEELRDATGNADAPDGGER